MPRPYCFVSFFHAFIAFIISMTVSVQFFMNCTYIICNACMPWHICRNFHWLFSHDICLETKAITTTDKKKTRRKPTNRSRNYLISDQNFSYLFIRIFLSVCLQFFASRNTSEAFFQTL